MNVSKVPSRPAFRNSRKDPERHRRAYEDAGQPWPTNLRKHLIRAQALEVAENHPSRRVA